MTEFELTEESVNALDKATREIKLTRWIINNYDKLTLKEQELMIRLAKNWVLPPTSLFLHYDVEKWRSFRDKK